MADVATILKDPVFHQLPIEERRKVLSTVDPNFAGLPVAEQDKVFLALAPSAELPKAPTPVSIPLRNSEGVMTPKGLDKPVQAHSTFSQGRPHGVSMMGPSNQAPLSGDEVAEAALAVPRFFGDAATQAGHGYHQMTHPESGKDFAQGFTNAAIGTSTLALPFAMPGMVAAPLKAARSLLVGTGVGEGTNYGLRSLGVSPEYSGAAGVVAGGAAGLLDAARQNGIQFQSPVTIGPGRFGQPTSTAVRSLLEHAVPAPVRAAGRALFPPSEAATPVGALRRVKLRSPVKAAPGPAPIWRNLPDVPTADLTPGEPIHGPFPSGRVPGPAPAPPPPGPRQPPIWQGLPDIPVTDLSFEPIRPEGGAFPLRRPPVMAPPPAPPRPPLWQGLPDIPTNDLTVEPIKPEGGAFPLRRPPAAPAPSAPNRLPIWQGLPDVPRYELEVGEPIKPEGGVFPLKRPPAPAPPLKPEHAEVVQRVLAETQGTNKPATAALADELKQQYPTGTVHLPPLKEGELPLWYQADRASIGDKNVLRNFAKDKRIAQHLVEKGITPEQWEAMPLEEQNAHIVNAPGSAKGGKNRAYVPGAQLPPGSGSRGAEHGIPQLTETLRYLWQHKGR